MFEFVFFYCFEVLRLVWKRSEMDAFFIFYFWIEKKYIFVVKLKSNRYEFRT